MIVCNLCSYTLSYSVTVPRGPVKVCPPTSCWVVAELRGPCSGRDLVTRCRLLAHVHQALSWEQKAHRVGKTSEVPDLMDALSREGDRQWTPAPYR